jgi:hypothetical protein
VWEERFRSVLVEGAGEALAIMAAYIDLNPIRAKIVEDQQITLGAAMPKPWPQAMPEQRLGPDWR